MPLAAKSVAALQELGDALRMALRAPLFLTSWVPALRQAAISTSPPVVQQGGAKLSRDASAFVGLMKRDGVIIVALVTGFTTFGVTRYSVSISYLISSAWP